MVVKELISKTVSTVGQGVVVSEKLILTVSTVGRVWWS